MHILAVDDDTLMLDLLVNMLQEIGYSDVETAMSADEALVITKLADRPFDCFLLDIKMPGGNGVQLCSDLRSMEAHKKTPVIMLTAMTERHFIDDAFLAGANDFVNKPLHMENLDRRLQVAFSFVTRRPSETKPIAQLLHADDGVFSTFDSAGFLELLDVPGMISNRALKMYLDKLDRVGSYRSSAFAVRLNIKGSIDFDPAMNSLSKLVLEVTNLLSKSLSNTSFVMSYVGGGTLVVITRRGDPIYSPKWKSSLRRKFQRRAVKYKAFENSGPELHVGPICSQGGLRDRTPMLLVEHAIRRMEVRKNRSGRPDVGVIPVGQFGRRVPGW